MGDVKKDVEGLRRMNASGSYNLKLMASLTAIVIRVNYERIKQTHPNWSNHAVLKKLHEDLFYGRRDNH